MVLSGPLPSMGLPSASTTRPSISRPTGTSRMRLVQRAVMPSERPWYSPSTTQPTESRSRFSAMPVSVAPLPSPNSIISPYCASARPWTRTMPSATLTMVPSLAGCAETSSCSMRPRMRSVISAGFSCACCMVSSSKSIFEARHGVERRRGLRGQPCCRAFTRRPRRPRTEPSITVSPARTTAPPSKAGSTVTATFTLRSNRAANASA